MNNVTVIEKNAEVVKETLTDEEKATFARLSEVRLSDLIRIGSRAGDQQIGGWIGESGEMCALSSALAGAKAYGLR